jgi:hypothetical protein
MSGPTVNIDFAGNTATGDGRDRVIGMNAVFGSSRGDVLKGAPGRQFFVPLGRQ